MSESTGINQRTNIKWDTYLATAYAEGFVEGENATKEEQIEAWAYLIYTNMAYALQGFFGRNATSLIENDVISSDGIINWELVDELDS